VVLIWEVTMRRVSKEFEEYARDCVRLAGQPKIPPDVRNQLFHMAREWMQAAIEEEETDFVPPSSSGSSHTHQ
jgi:hypothetical protein